MRLKIIFLFIIFSTSIYSQNHKTEKGFIENKGQIIDQNGKPNKNVLYLLNTRGLNVQIKKNGFSYDIYETEEKQSKKSKLDLFEIIENKKEPKIPKKKYKFHRIDIDFKDSNPNVEIIATEKSLDFENYYNIPNKPEGITQVHRYKKITYKNLYKNIDVDFFVPNDNAKPVEYNFKIKPGGKISDIKMKFNGVKTELIDNKIKIKVRFGQMEETIPMSWIDESSRKTELNINYKKIDNNIYGFESNSLSSNKTIIIDPVPIRLWGTYYGGEGIDIPLSLTTDHSNKSYISGFTNSQNNIASANSYQSTIIGTYNLFITKFTPDGTREWGTYFSIENNQNNSQNAILCVDFDSNIYFTGKELYNSNLGTAGTFQPIKDDYNDVYLVKLNSSGFKIWGTYFGGNGNEYPTFISKDKNNNIYICGATTSTTNISSVNAHQINNNSIKDYEDAFIAKFDSTGNRIWSTFYGGEGSEGFYSINISNDNFIYATGTRNSLTNIATPYSFQPSTTIKNGGMIVKFDLNGNRIWGSYICDNSEITVSSHKNNQLIIGGITWDKTNISTPNTFKPQFIKYPYSSSQQDYAYYCMSFDVSTEKINWGTYIPGIIVDFKQNNNNEIYVGGTFVEGYPEITTPNAFQFTKGLNSETPYILKLDTQGNRQWGTYYSGENGGYGGQLSLDNEQNIYLFGATNSETGIATSGSHQESPNSNHDLFLAKFKDCFSQTSISSNSPICPKQNLELKASGGTNYSWTGPNGFTSIDQNPILTNVNQNNSGTYYCTITGTSAGCDATLETIVKIEDTEKPIPNSTSLPTITGDCNTVITTTPTATDNCSGLINATTTDALSYSKPGNYTIHWTYDDGNGNIETQNQNVTITSVVLPTTTSPHSFCIQQNARINDIAITGQNIKWYDAPTNGNLLFGNTVLQNNSTYYASQTINGCESERIPVIVNITTTPAPSGNSNQSFCTSQNATLYDIQITGNDVKWYDSATNGNLLNITTPLQNNTTYFASQTQNGCESVQRAAVTIELINTLNATNFEDHFCDDTDKKSVVIDLGSYQNNLITNTNGSTFSYYKTKTGAENQDSNQKINNFKNYTINIGSEIIFVRIDNINTCHQIVELTLNLYPKPKPQINNSIPICEGSSITINPGIFDAYEWSTGATSPSITITTEGDYWVTVGNNYNSIQCETRKDFKVLKSNIATIENILISDMTTNDNQITVVLNSQSTGEYEYSIDGVNYQAANTFTNLPSGEYTVYVNDKNGCGLSKKDIYLLMYPKYFTPNGDGYNDTWRVKFSEKEGAIAIKIFNRFGKLLKTLNSPYESWNGIYQNERLPSDDYWFTLTRSNGVEYKGHFSLKR